MPAPLSYHPVVGGGEGGGGGAAGDGDDGDGGGGDGDGGGTGQAVWQTYFRRDVQVPSFHLPGPPQSNFKQSSLFP